jgi:hypothetical protein
MGGLVPRALAKIAAREREGRSRSARAAFPGPTHRPALVFWQARPRIALTPRRRSAQLPVSSCSRAKEPSLIMWAAAPSWGFAFRKNKPRRTPKTQVCYGCQVYQMVRPQPW